MTSKHLMTLMLSSILNRVLYQTRSMFEPMSNLSQRNIFSETPVQNQIEVLSCILSLIYLAYFFLFRTHPVHLNLGLIIKQEESVQLSPRNNKLKRFLKRKLFSNTMFQICISVQNKVCISVLRVHNVRDQWSSLGVLME